MTKKQIGKKIITEFVGTNQATVHEIRELQAKYTIRRKADILHLPEMQEIEMLLSVKYVPVNNEEMFQSFQEYVKHQKMSEVLFTYKRNIAISKAEATSEYLNTMSEPIVVFSDYPEALKRIQQHLERKSEIIDGSTPLDTRQNIVDSFQNGELNIVLASIGALSEGVTLTKAAKVIYNDLNYSPIKLQQSQGRIYRIGQTQNCQTIYLVASDLDKRILRILKSKQDDIKTIIK